MIKADCSKLGVLVSVEGNTVEVLEELVAILESVKNTLSDVQDDEFAKRAIAYCGQLAFIDDDKEREDASKDFYDYLISILLKKEEVV